MPRGVSWRAWDHGLAGGGAGAKHLVRAPGWGLATRPRFFPPVLELRAIPAVGAHQRLRGFVSIPMSFCRESSKVTFQEDWKL